ncbi:DUF2218 domain-containing protein [Microvirga pakistanensis]|uniref:DUF2218 domain-containing protein n=1 Tax=Microvirga pakistanensis TaxID=1682650 RepID=UPI001069BA23|nr:DUF2218 domain-containing protein [Microvirga pakistanensis]
MLSTEARVPTAHASRYLQQLSKHWSHKFAVAFDETSSTIPFSEDRRAELTAEPDHLRIRLTVPDEETRDRMRKVLEDHLNRFAFRETLAYAWT